MWSLEGEGAAGELGANNLIWSIVMGAVLTGCAAFSDEPGTKVIAYSHIPLTLLSAYNAFVSENAKEVVPSDSAKYGFLAYMVVMLAAILL